MEWVMILKETCAQVTHYRNASAKRDYVPRIDKDGAARSAEAIVDVVSHADARWFDHDFQSLTYKENLIKQIKHFLKQK
jgi:hypothetical protein